MLMRTAVMAVSAAVAAMMFGCSPQPSATVAVVKDKIYSVTPAAMKVKSGIVTKLSGKLVLKNVSSDQTLRLIGGKVLYIDMQGKPIKLEENRTAPMLRIASSYGSQERLDPGQDSTQTLDADFPAAALGAKKLKEIRLELSYIPSSFREEALNFNVSIGGGEK